MPRQLAKRALTKTSPVLRADQGTALTAGARCGSAACFSTHGKHLGRNPERGRNLQPSNSCNGAAATWGDAHEYSGREVGLESRGRTEAQPVCKGL